MTCAMRCTQWNTPTTKAATVGRTFGNTGMKPYDVRSNLGNDGRALADQLRQGSRGYGVVAHEVSKE